MVSLCVMIISSCAERTVFMAVTTMALLRLLCCALGPKRWGDMRTLVFLTSTCLLVLFVVPNQAQDGMDCFQSPLDCVAGETFDATTGCCRRCSSCQDHERMFVVSECNVTHDAVCDCRSPTYLDPTSHICALDCELCPSTGSCLPGRTECQCLNQACHLPGDIYCDNPVNPPCRPTVAQLTTTPPERPGGKSGFDQNSFPAWGIGLIAVGIVIGIIIFASCFLCMGIFTMHRNSDPESQRGSESSENGLFPRDSFSSVGTKSSYVSSSSSMYPYLSNHSMLELLKNSNPHMLHSSKDKLSSVHSSPVSARASPKPGGIVRLAKNSSNDKLTAIVL